MPIIPPGCAPDRCLPCNPPTTPAATAAAPQAAIAPRPVGLDAPAAGGDGFTYEHLAHRDELWWDFVADTGDGGDPTYA